MIKQLEQQAQIANQRAGVTVDYVPQYGPVPNPFSTFNPDLVGLTVSVNTKGLQGKLQMVAFLDEQTVGWSKFEELSGNFIATKDLPDFSQEHLFSAPLIIPYVKGPALGAADSEVLATFDGEVQSLIGEFALVTMSKERTSEEFIGKCYLSNLTANKIGVGDRFKLFVRRVLGSVQVDFQKIRQPRVSAEEVEKRRQRFADLE